MSQYKLSYAGMIGTGGIGTGNYFKINGDSTLGREESRSGRFLERRDYCKLHIICHYIKALLGDPFVVLPIGKVGDDEIGTELLGEMLEHGLDLRFVSAAEGFSTLYSFCFLYPDGSGGNLTTDNSASTEVDAVSIDNADAMMAELGSKGIALAAPEVPLATRLRLLERAGEHKMFRVASFTTEEIPRLQDADLGSIVELIALNESEAAAFLGEVSRKAQPREMVSALAEQYPSLQISMTAGARGSWSRDGDRLTHVPAAPVEVETTGGAGDAHLAGIIAGIVTGLSLADAQRVGSVMAAASVRSPHTINFEVTREELAQITMLTPELGGVRELFC